MGGLFIPERPDVLQRVYDLRALSPWALACVICALGKPHVATCEHACHGFKIGG